MQMPEEDQYLLGQRELEERLAVLLGGRSAELLIVGEASTGAANDLERATELARRMVTEFGMAEALGPVRYAPQAGAGYLGRMAGVRPELSPETAATVDAETRRLVEAAQAQAMGLLRENEGLLHKVAETLLEQETISGDEIARIVEGVPL
jgi:cell division protease FtsH